MNDPKAEENASLEAEKQKENVQNFLTFAKDKAGVKEADLFKQEDLDSPAKGLPAVLSTLTSLGAGAKEKFGAEGMNVESLMKMAAESGAKNFIMNLFNRFFKKNSSPSSPTAESAKDPPQGVSEKKEAPPVSSPEKPDTPKESPPAQNDSAPKAEE